MARFLAHNRMGGTQQALTTTFKTQVNIVGATTKRARIWRINYGPEGAPNATDCSIVYEMATKDATTAGTATAVTAQKVDSSNGAVTLGVNVNYTVEGTTFTSIWTDSINQRANGMFQAFDQDSAPTIAAIASIGIGVRALAVATYTGLVNVAVLYEEL